MYHKHNVPSNIYTCMSWFVLIYLTKIISFVSTKHALIVTIIHTHEATLHIPLSTTIFHMIWCVQLTAISSLFDLWIDSLNINCIWSIERFLRCVCDKKSEIKFYLCHWTNFKKFPVYIVVIMLLGFCVFRVTTKDKNKFLISRTRCVFNELVPIKYDLENCLKWPNEYATFQTCRICVFCCSHNHCWKPQISQAGHSHQ